MLELWVFEVRVNDACIVLILLASIAGAGHAGSMSDEVGTCANKQAEPGVSIAACTNVLNSGQLNEHGQAGAYFDRSLAYAKKKDFDRGIDDLNMVIHIQPNNAEAFSNRGVMHGFKGELDVAIADLTHAIQLNPEDDIAFFDRGKMFVMKHNYVRAIQDYNRAIKIKPNNSVALNGRCWLRSTIGTELDAAMSDCNEALRLGPGDANILNSRGFVHFRTKQYKEAITDYDAAIAHDASVGSSYYVRGLAKLALGNARDAAVDIKHGKSLEPGIAHRFAGYGISTR